MKTLCSLAFFVIALVQFASAQCSVTANVVSNVSCFNECNAVVVADPAGGTPPYTYGWIPSSCSTQTCTGLCAGLYAIEVTDAVGCTATSSVITISQPQQLTANAQVLSNVSCNGGNNGSAYVVAGGGTTPYTYVWSPPGDENDTLYNVSAGCYTVTVTDNNGCATSSAICITEPTQLFATVCESDPPLCNGGSTGCAGVCTSGGTPNYTYLWNPSGLTGTTVCNLVAGCYTCTTTDGNGCTTTATVCISEPAQLTISLDPTDASCSSCNDGFIATTVNGGIPGYTYLWTPTGQNAPTATGLPPGVYTCCVSDENGCSTCATDTVSYPTSVNDISSQGNPVAIIPNPFTNELSIIWNKGSGSKKQVSFFDLTGKEILRKETSDEELKLNTENLAAGFYLLRAGGENYKVVKEN